MIRSLTIPIGAGSEPELIEIDDASEAVGEFEVDDYGDVFELCPRSPSDQCVYSMTDNFKCCIHCGRESGL